MNKVLILFILFLLNRETLAASNTEKSFSFIPGIVFDSFSLGFGSFSSSPGQVQTDNIGTLNSLEFNLLMTVDFNFNLSENFDLSNSNGITLPQDGRDGSGISIWTFYTDFFVSYKKVEHWHFLLGAGWIFNKISGEGGTQAIENGIGVDNFILPNGSTTSYNLVVNAGAKYFVSPKWNINLQTYIYNLLESDGGDLSLALTFQQNFKMEKLF